MNLKEKVLEILRTLKKEGQKPDFNNVHLCLEQFGIKYTPEDMGTLMTELFTEKKISFKSFRVIFFKDGYARFLTTDEIILLDR